MRHSLLLIALAACGGESSTTVDAPAAMPDAFDTASCLIKGDFGAVGSVHGPLLGAFILATINNGANLLNVNSFWQRVITGALIIIIVYFDGLRRRGK